eukprot:24769-Eustigmatos_ZCMA.PRE.1
MDAASMLNQLRDIADGHPNKLRDGYKHVKQVAYGLEKCDDYRQANGRLVTRTGGQCRVGARGGSEQDRCMR